MSNPLKTIKLFKTTQLSGRIFDMNTNIFLSKTNYDFKDKKVLLRFDCDVDLKTENGKPVVDEDFRLKTVLPTIKFLLDRGVVKIILIGHMGRPEGMVQSKICLIPIAEWFRGRFVETGHAPSLQINWNDGEYWIDQKIILLENLRFNKGEEENDEGFAKDLGNLGDVYINDAFGVSHRQHASITGIPKFLPSFLGLNFENEIKMLGELKERPQRPLVFVLGGSKKDKLDYLEFLGEWCDKVLVGGKLPQEVKTQNSKVKIESQKSKVLLAKLKIDGKDLSQEDIKIFKERIKEAKTVVWAGPMGVYEEKENQKGTFEIAKAVTEVNGTRIAGGGDTHRIISWLNLWNKFDFVSSGGGAMLAFLKNDTLPGIEAIN